MFNTVPFSFKLSRGVFFSVIFIIFRVVFRVTQKIRLSSSPLCARDEQTKFLILKSKFNLVLGSIQKKLKDGRKYNLLVNFNLTVYISRTWKLTRKC